MSYEPKRCAGPDCNRIGVPQDRDLCHFCQLREDEGPEAERKALQEAGRRSQKRGRLDIRSLPRLKDHRTAMVWLAALVEGVAREQVSRKLAAEVRKGIRAYLDAYKGHVTDEIVAEIRSELDQLREQLQAQGEPWR